LTNGHREQILVRIERLMRRLTTLLALVVLLAPLVAEAQPRIGVLLFGTPANDPNLAAFRRGLADLGHVEGRTIVLEYRYADGKAERLPQLARELVALKPSVLFALGGDVAPALKAATGAIPLVVSVSLDPVQAGLVADLARPRGNITGVTFVSSELAAKRLQFLKEVAPAISRVGILWNPEHPDFEYKETLLAAQRLGVQVQSLEVRKSADFDAAFRAATEARAEAIMVATSRQMLVNRQRIFDFGARQRILLVSGWGPWAEAGALLSYGPDIDDLIRRAAIQVDKILKGARPGDLPIEQPTRFELVLNLKTARAFQLTIPPSLTARASRVIE
jgi:putative ABC transport system substrate-binding protein